MTNQPMFDLAFYLTHKQTQINRALTDALPEEAKNAPIVCAMQYSLMAGGKRLRPILCLAAAEAVGGDPARTLAAACALEMIHTYSLIHDDLPCMDDDALRRGKPTCHVAFDEATALLAGDALLTMAFSVLSGNGSGPPAAPEKMLSVIRIIAKAAGCLGMIEGQMRDMQAEGRTLSFDALKALHALKTGALIQAAIRSGAILGGGSSEQIHQLERYADQIGLAFQVRDDILNVEGDPRVMGKAAGTDKDRHKSTFPGLLGLDESKRFAEKRVQNALQALNGFDNKADPLRAIAQYIIDRKK